jgi:hypothetical protein
MAANLDAIAGVTVVVGRIDDTGRQPQDALLDLVEDGQIGAHAAGPGCGDYHSALRA